MVIHSFFQALRAFCQLSEDTIENTFEEFQSQNYISTVLMTRNSLKTQTNATINQLKSTTTNRFTSFLRMIMDTSHVNTLETILFPYYELYLMDGSLTIEWSLNLFDGECRCIYNAGCSMRAAIYDNHNLSVLWYMPGFYQGCFIVAGLRNSHLECLYNATCLEELDLYLESAVPLNVTPLDASLLIHFSVDTTMGSIIEELMVDEWQGSDNFARYYNACRPNECTYTIIGRDSAVGIATTVIGLIGGLITILKLTIPRLVRFVRWMIKPRATSLIRGK